MDISLAHTQRSTAMAQPIPTPIPMRTHRGAPNGVRRAVIGLCLKQSLYATTLWLEFWLMHFVRTYAPM